MGLIKTRFDLFIEKDVSRFNELISDPNVIIERRNLRYRSKIIPGVGDEDPEFEEFLELFVSYSTSPDRAVDNTFTKAKIISVRKYGSKSHRYYMDFISSEERDIISTKEAHSERLMYVLVEYIDLNDMVNMESKENLCGVINDEIFFDAQSGTFMSR